MQFPAKRLTSDSWSAIVNDLYNRPLPQRPYYYIHNVNTSQNVPTNPYIDGSGTDEGLDNTKYHLIHIKELSEINKFDDPSLFDNTKFTNMTDHSN